MKAAHQTRDKLEATDFHRLLILHRNQWEHAEQICQYDHVENNCKKKERKHDADGCTWIQNVTCRLDDYFNKLVPV